MIGDARTEPRAGAPGRRRRRGRRRRSRGRKALDLEVEVVSMGFVGLGWMSSELSPFLLLIKLGWRRNVIGAVCIELAYMAMLISLCRLSVLAGKLI